MCVCNWYPGCVIWPNYEVVGFQPWSGMNTFLYYVAYYYVPITRLLCYSSTQLICHTGSSAHLSVARIRPIISSLHTGSSTHLGVACLHLIISDFPLICPHCYPWPLMHGPLSPSPDHIFPQYFIQGCPNLCLLHLLTPPCFPPTPYPLISILPCAHLENRLQRYPLCHRPLYSSNVDYH